MSYSKDLRERAVKYYKPRHTLKETSEIFGAGINTISHAVIVMDNASFHRKKQLGEIAANNNITLIFLPPYSPKLNPIEKVWANMKKFL